MQVTDMQYDVLKRLVEVDSPAGTRSMSYDRFGNVVLEVDEKGNTRRHEYDFAGRRLETMIDLRADGTGSTAVVGTITLGQSFDLNGRLLSQTDDNGNATRYAYDALNRQVATRKADGTFTQAGSGLAWSSNTPLADFAGFSSGYDEFGRMFSSRDAMGSVVSFSFDELGRVVEKSISKPLGVVGPTAEAFAYDGASRVVRATNNNSKVERTYDSLGNVVEERFWIDNPGAGTPEAAWSAVYRAPGMVEQFNYPGGMEVVTTYDARFRPFVQSADEELVSATWYDIFGEGDITLNNFGGTTEVRVFGNGAYQYKERDSAGRTRATSWYDAAPGVGNLLSHLEFDWDDAGNKTRWEDLTRDVKKLYTYDSADRLIRSDVLDTNDGMRV